MFQCSFNIRSKTNLSYQHMQSAIHLLALSKECERVNYGKTFSDGNFWDNHRSYVNGAILTSVAALEAHINEFYLEATDKLLGGILDVGSQELLAEIWLVAEKKRFPILDKYQIALAAIKKTKFDTAKAPYQDVKSLINLRNMLVHYKPVWDDDQKEHSKIENDLRGRFELNPFLPDEEVFFPFKFVSYDCAKWAVMSSMKFIMQFFFLTGVDPQTDMFMIWNRLNDSF